MSRPLEEPEPSSSFVVLRNGEDQYALWPAFAEIPGGWTVAHAEGDRRTCLEHIEQQWTDMRPTSLANTMKRDVA
ncbi:MbtH family NRPS accessory protein [Streptomyces sp. NPDC038707]|uniref:MbtH family protein n=1 Tax=unclassified Streptomyces TaxID=2593676 RepID=UPI0033EB5E11